MPFFKKATIYYQIAVSILLSMHLISSTAQSSFTAKGIQVKNEKTTHSTKQSKDALTTRYYEIAVQYGSKDYTNYQPDSAYHYARLASKQFRKLSKREQKRLKKSGLSQKAINRFRSEQKEAALDFALAQNTVQAIDHYLETYPRIKDEWKEKALVQKFQLQLEQFEKKASFKEVLGFLRANEAELQRYHASILRNYNDVLYQRYFEVKDSNNLMDLLHLLDHCPFLAYKADVSLSNAIKSKPYLAIVEKYLEKVEKTSIPNTMNSIYQYYASDGQARHLFAFARRYPEFKTAPSFTRDLAIANMGPKIQGRRILKKSDLVNYIEKGGDKYLAFQALQVLIKKDIDIHDWQGAIQTIQTYASHFGKENALIQNLIEILQKERHLQRAENLGLGLNTNMGEYAVVVSADEASLYFCRGGEGQENIFSSKKVEDKWSTAQAVESLNSEKGFEAPLAISADGNTLLYFRNGRVMYSYRSFSAWTKAEPLFSDQQASDWQGGTSISADGNAIIFAARRSNRIGLNDEDNIDLFVVTKKEDGTWSEPVNLGLNINTPLEERSPFLHPDMRTLYFSSNGRGGLGELDVFKTTRIGNGWTEWTKPVNLGKSVNTTGKDWGYRISTDGQRAYFSARVPQFGDDLFCIDLPEDMRPQKVSTIAGVLKDLDGNAIKAPLLIEDLSTGKLVKRVYPDPKTGEYFLTLPSGNLYSYTVEGDEYYPVADNIDLRDSTQSVQLSANIIVPTFAEMTERGISLPLRNLFFDTDKYEIREESHLELKRLLEIVRKRNLKIKIAGYTDNVGGKKHNLALSNNRANAVKSFLIQNGCPAEWIKAKGYGMENALAENTSEEGRAKNRRVEITLLKK